MQDELKARLTELGFSGSQIGKLEAQGVTSEADMARLNEQEIRKISGCTVIAAKKAVEAFAPKPTEAESVVSNTAALQNILPALPDDSSFTEMLKTGGVLKIDRTNVIAAMRAAIASNVGLFDLPDKLIERMETFALEQDEPLGDTFYKLQKQLTRRDYGEILSVLGTTGTFVSDRRKRETLTRLNTLLWPALREFNTQLRTWVETWSQGAANPAAMMMVIMSQGGAHGIMPPGMLQPPATDVLRDKGETVIDQINKVFAGTGIPVSRALAYDAMQIREVLEDANLPSTVGAATRDQMLKMLGIEVGAEFVRLERNVTQFALAIMELPKVATGSDELAYLSAMWQLGSQIPWDKLGTGTSVSSSRIGRNPALVHGDRPPFGDSDR